MAEDDVWEKARLARIAESKENSGLFGKTQEELVEAYQNRLKGYSGRISPLPKDPVIDRRTLVDLRGRSRRKR